MDKMNIAFICTGEFEPFFYDCMAKQLERDGIKVFYVGFFLDTRRAIAKINRACYPATTKKADRVAQKVDNYLFNPRELEDIIRYDYLRIQANGIDIKKEKLVNKAVYYEKFFYNFYKECNINAIIIWNSFPLMTHVAWKVARKVGIRQIFFENGLFTNTLMIDTQGVNYQSSLTQNKRGFYETVEFKPDVWRSFINDYKNQKKTSVKQNKGIMNFWQKLYYAILMRNYFYRDFYPDLTDDKIRQSVYKKLYTRFLVKEENVELPEHFIFLPFQYPYDTQILINSPNINDMSSFLRVCYVAIKKAVPSNYRIVVKEHPDDIGRTSYSKLKKKYPDIIWLKKYNIRELIEKAKLIITINSSVGIEALIRHKPVITLGKSFYNIDGVVYHVEEPDKLEETIKTALEKPVNRELIDKFLYYLRFEYLVRGSPRYCDEESLHQAYIRIKEILRSG